MEKTQLQNKNIEHYPTIERIRRFESLVVSKIERLASKISLAAEKLETAKKEKLKKRGREMLDRICSTARMVGFIAVLSTALDTLNFAVTRYEVMEEKDTGGNTIFHHEDSETEAIINFMSGKLDLPKDIQLKIMRARLRLALEHAKKTVPTDLEKLNEPEIKQKYNEIYGTKLADFYLVPQKSNPKSSLYQSLWEIEKMAGSPKIRILNVDHQTSSGKKLLWRDRSFYIPQKNTMYVNIDMGYEHFIEESAHRKQWHDNHLRSGLRARKDMITEIINSVKMGNSKTPSYGRAHDKMYEIPGTIEYEAHKQISPELRRKIPK